MNTMMIVRFEKRKERFPHRIFQGLPALIKTSDKWFANERIFIFMRIATRRATLVICPKPEVCYSTLSTNVAIVMKYC